MAQLLTRSGRFLVLAATVAAMEPNRAAAAPAQFWLSETNLDPAPEAPVLSAVVGTPRPLQIWVRPATEAGGAYKNLRSFSLDVRALQPSIDLLDLGSTPQAAITVYNPPAAGSAGRFEFVNDSSVATVPLESLVNGGGASDGILGIGGFTITSSSHAGLGTSCDSNDRYCGTDGVNDAWLLGTFSFTPLSSGTAHLVLQIGQNGISHNSEDSSATDVLFGTGSTIYNANSHRQVTLPGDLVVEATINAVAAATTTTWAGSGGDWSTATWSAGTPTGAHNALLSPAAGQTLSVSGRQAANDTQVVAGRLHVDSAGSLASKVTVQSSGSLSGGGWVMGDVDNTSGGTQVIDAIETLRVADAAHIAGGHLVLGENYSQPAGTLTAPWDVLQAHHVSGMFSEAVGTYLGRGIFLASILHDGDAVTLQLRNLPGDYNGDGSVDGLDFAVWTTAFGAAGTNPADGSLDGRIGGGDYVVWRNNVGRTATLLGSGASFAVPEPTGAWMWLMVGLGTLQMRRSRRSAIPDRLAQPITRPTSLPPPASRSCE